MRYKAEYLRFWRNTQNPIDEFRLIRGTCSNAIYFVYTSIIQRYVGTHLIVDTYPLAEREKPIDVGKNVIKRHVECDGNLITGFALVLYSALLNK